MIAKFGSVGLMWFCLFLDDFFMGFEGFGYERGVLDGIILEGCFSLSEKNLIEGKSPVLAQSKKIG